MVPGIIAVFAKPPKSGEVKTRLAARIGPDAAATLARAFFGDTWQTLGAIQSVRKIIASTSDDLASFGLEDAELWLQGEGDLGDRLERIALRALSQAPWVIALGADSPGLPLREIEAAQAALQDHDAVLGPADDGGYYLIGFRRMKPDLLCNLPWSASNTFAATRERLVEQGMTVYLGAPYFDVDEPEDLIKLQKRMRDGLIEAPLTAEALSKLNLFHGVEPP